MLGIDINDPKDVAFNSLLRDSVGETVTFTVTVTGLDFQFSLKRFRKKIVE